MLYVLYYIILHNIIYIYKYCRYSENLISLSRRRIYGLTQYSLIPKLINFLTIWLHVEAR